MGALFVVFGAEVIEADLLRGKVIGNAVSPEGSGPGRLWTSPFATRFTSVPTHLTGRDGRLNLQATAGRATGADFRIAIAPAIEPNTPPTSTAIAIHVNICGSTPNITHFFMSPISGTPGGRPS